MSQRSIERLHAPAHFQERIAQAGGLNRYGEPNFRLAWAQTETTRQGGHWNNEDGSFTGYRDVYLGDGLPHWMLLQWADAGKSIEMPHMPAMSDVRWYDQMKCPVTGLSLCGQYPYRGHYQVALNLCAKWFDGQQLHIKPFPLSTEIVNMMIPVIRASLKVSMEVKLREMRNQREKDDDDFARAVDNAWNSVKRKETLASTEWLEQKQRSIEKHFNAALLMKMNRDRVFQSRQRVGEPLYG